MQSVRELVAVDSLFSLMLVVNREPECKSTRSDWITSVGLLFSHSCPELQRSPLISRSSAAALNNIDCLIQREKGEGS